MTRGRAATSGFRCSGDLIIPQTCAAHSSFLPVLLLITASGHFLNAEVLFNSRSAINFLQSTTRLSPSLPCSPRPKASPAERRRPFLKHAFMFPTFFPGIYSLDPSNFELKCSLFPKVLLDLLSWSEIAPFPEHLVYTLLGALLLVDFVLCDYANVTHRKLL